MFRYIWIGLHDCAIYYCIRRIRRCYQCFSELHITVMCVVAKSAGSIQFPTIFLSGDWNLSGSLNCNRWLANMECLLSVVALLKLYVSLALGVIICLYSIIV